MQDKKIRSYEVVKPYYSEKAKELMKTLKGLGVKSEELAQEIAELILTEEDLWECPIQED